MGTSYDVVIVGGGSAGCVLAARLSADPARRVLLVEAGPDYGSRALPADLAEGMQGPAASHDWGLRGVGVRGGPPLDLPRGRVMGGSSAVNATFALRGHPADYDAWAAAGAPGWAFDDVLPSFARLERDLDFGAADYHGSDGPLPIRRYAGAERSAVTDAAEEAITSLGLPLIADHNAPAAVGVAPLPVNAVDGRRISTASAYLDPCRSRANLDILADSLVRDVVIRHGRVTGVRLDGTGEVVPAGEVIVAAGAYLSPGLLLRSGVGPAADVAVLGRSVVADLPGVGSNLVDHPAVSIDLPFVGPVGSHARYQLVATCYSGSVTGPPDLQLVAVGPYPLDAGAHGCSIFAALLKPASRGRVLARSPDAAVPPDIDLGYFDHGADLPRLIEGLRLAEAVTRTPAWEAITAAPVAGLPAGVFDDPAVTRAWVRANTWTYHHPVGSCAMGADPEEGAVVGPEARVFGVVGLSVVDASIMPDIPSANTNLPTVMVAEHVAARWEGGRPNRTGAEQGATP
ncbi:GMC family oxidoreductase [Kitasatospora sp. NPDC090091]|uniref:GMC family oxidoreductase n=1 Tax=Kitasatospora sp. NPDC090091 TaxID=3364081 RepID=UPI003826B67E